MLDFEALEKTQVTTNPFPFLIVPNFVTSPGCNDINTDFPVINSSGSFPLAELNFGPKFQKFIDQLQGDEFRKLISEKFNVTLDNAPTTITVRGKCSQKDGRIHTDTKTKIITVLIYLNPAWENSGGRLRLLKNAHDIHDYITEVSPSEGTLLVFKVTPHSWHGHLPFTGDRRVIQLNWVTDQSVVDREIARHRFSAKIKKFKNWLGLSKL